MFMLSSVSLYNTKQSMSFCLTLVLIIFVFFFIWLRIDKKMSDREKMAGFKAPGRPKNWRKRCIDELKKVVNIK